MLIPTGARQFVQGPDSHLGGKQLVTQEKLSTREWDISIAPPGSDD
jgi:hypothetical protein